MAKKKKNTIEQLMKGLSFKERIIMGVIILVLTSVGVLQLEDETTPPRYDSVTTELVQGFDGTNFEVIPKEVKIPFNLERVVDGDTIVGNINGETVRIRYLLVDTPESVKPGMSVQPFAKEASYFNEQLLTQANTLYLALDEGPRTDRYDRLLAYIYADDQFVQETLIRNGYAIVAYVYPPNDSYEGYLKAVQQEAQQAQIGVWGISGYVNDEGKFTPMP